MKFANEFFYFDPNFQGEHGDFTDDSVFSPEEREKYLEHYASYLKNQYSLGEKSVYVVPFDEAVKLKDDLDRPECAGDSQFTKMKAYTLQKPDEYQNWSLYTGKAVVEHDSQLVLKGTDLPPNPSAIYRFASTERVSSLSLDFWMEEVFHTHINGRISDTTPGYTIEFRNGIKEIIKLQFYGNGQCYIKNNIKCPYAAEHILLGDYKFGEWNSLEIRLGTDTCEVSLNGEAGVLSGLTHPDNPDSLFFCGGMFHYADWKIIPKELCFEQDRITQFFTKAEPQMVEKRFLDEVSLPYALGGYENRDQILVLETEFKVKGKNRSELCFDSLDPGGRIFIDDICVAKTDGFEEFQVDVTKYADEKVHTLRVEVSPRAPEVLFEWHRHKDPYMGWFCEKITLKEYGQVEFSKARVRSLKVEKARVTALFSGEVSQACKVQLWLAQFWNGMSQEEMLFETSADSAFCEECMFSAKAWTPDTPNLYRVRFIALDESGNVLGEEVIETGFRTIEQKNGQFILNGERLILKGALQMQFLPPYKETPITHVCPKSEQIVWQNMMLKALGGNTMRLHMLGYGSNDERYAKYADRMGVLLIWITRYIDSLEGMEWSGGWRGKDAYIRQIENRINHPSIIMWEGANEFHPTREQIDAIHEAFVPAVKEVDTSRLLSPISHLYYAADLYPTLGCGYYNDTGTADELGNEAKASPYWTDPLVVRSAHTYSLLLGYGRGWDKLRTQDWSEQATLFTESERAYMVSEFAVIGRQDPNTKEAKEEYFNPYSYEFPDEKVLGFPLSQDKWLTSQAYQALSAHEGIKQLRLNDADGMLWCCLLGGANDGGYLKPIIDNYGYAKLAFYVMQNAFSDSYVTEARVDVKRGAGFAVQPVLFSERGKKYRVTVNVVDEEQNVVDSCVYDMAEGDSSQKYLKEWQPRLTQKGYYGIIFDVMEF